jgi:lysophospholipase L1-like esterase
VLFAFVFIMSTNAPLIAGPKISPEMKRRMLLVPGDTSRLRSVFAKAAAGETLTIGFVGGSITAGATASESSRRYASQLTRWFQDRFSGEIREANAGCGGTGTDFAAYRLGEDLLRQKPDLVFVEFSVNDAGADTSTASMEAVIRQILTQPQEPAVVMIGMLRSKGENAQAFHEPVAHRYQIPFLSIRDALWPEIVGEAILWPDLFVDTVHPNDVGHALTAQLIGTFLEAVRNQAPKAAQKRTGCLPEPLDAGSDDYFRSAVVRADGAHTGPVRLVRNAGWKVLPQSRHGAAWESLQPESEIVFEFEGTRVALLVHRSGAGMGFIEAAVNDRPFRSFDTHTLEKLQNNSAVFPVESDLPAGRHTIVVRHSPRKNPESPGNRLELRMVMVAGSPE